MSDIFLSYKSEDRARAKIIAEALEREGYSVWWDRTIPPGKTFYQVIEEALDATKCVMVLWSRVSVLSDWVKNEAREGVRRRVLVPVLIDDVNIPFEFRHIQAAQLIDWQGSLPNSEFDSLLKSITEIVGRSTIVKTEIKKQSINDLNSSAQLLFDEGKYAEAIDKWKEVLMLDSENPKAIKGIEDAERFLKLIEINGLNIFAQSLFDEGKYAKSIEKWNEVLNLDSENNVAIEGIDNARRIQRGGEERAQREREEQEGTAGEEKDLKSLLQSNITKKVTRSEPEYPTAQKTVDVVEGGQEEEIGAETGTVLRKPPVVWVRRSPPKREFKVPSYFTYILGILLLAAFALSLYLRTVMPYDSVFRDGVVAFASDDAVYQMRLVENTLVNFPHRIFYDPFTTYPYGSSINFGPLFTQIIATLSLIAGLGSYNMQTVNAIAAFFPSVLGALVVFPVYYIGKHLVNRSTGLFAAFMIAILPGQFLDRSTLGFTDNHVAEVLFSTATIAFFILAIKAGREKNIKFSDVHLNEKSVLYSIFAGIMLAAYQLSWTGALFFAMIIVIFIIIQYIIDDMQGRSTDYVAVAAVPMFLVDLIVILPYFHPDYGFQTVFYSWFHVAVALIGMLIPIVLSVISRELKRRGYKSDYYPLFLGGFFVLSILLMKIILPQMYDTMVNAPAAIFAVHTGGAATIGEATSILASPGALWRNFPITGPWQNDNLVLLFIMVVLLIFSYRIVRKQKPEDMLFLVWSIVMLLAIYGENRWAYYFAINVALMVGYAGSNISEGILKSSGWELPLKENIGASHVLSLILVVIILLFFAYPAFSETYAISKYGGGDPSGGGFAEWLDALNWMRSNTPDPGLDYLAIYEMPKNSSSPYPYPETAYGIMSWWDYGHIITYWAHRIPNANPFHSGIGGGSQHAPGASTFLTAKSEDEANDVLNALGINGKPGARYIVSNAHMAYEIMPIFATWNDEDYRGYYVQVQTAEGPLVVPSVRYYENMEAKLHIFDGNGLKHYRLVHESPQNPYTQGGNDEKYYKKAYNLLYDGNISLENSGFVKVFEYVKGAKITGRAPPGITIYLTNTIKTNIGRTVQYSQTTTSNGTYEFTVPYSTLLIVTDSFDCTGCFFKGDTRFDTIAAGPYTVTFGKVSRQIDVSEKDVLEGSSVNFDLV